MSQADTRLLFVYNADSGLFTALKDAAHKLLSPETYPCSLCAITYGAVSMRGEWKAWLQRQPLPPEFLHRDEHRRRYPSETTALPAVFVVRDERPELLLGPQELDRVRDVGALTALLDMRLAERAA